MRPVLTLMLAGSLLCMAGCQPRVDAPRLLVLGIDGMDPQILSRLMASGRMPHFSALAKSGGFTSLATTMPPQSPVAWSTFITGLDPEGHGIFDFIHRDPATLTPYLSTSRKGTDGTMELLRRGRPFWDALVDRHIPVTIFKVPANFPPSPSPHSGLFSGIFGCSCYRAFAGMGTPDIMGTYGMFTYYTDGDYTVPLHMNEGGKTLPSGGELSIAGGRVVSLQPEKDFYSADIHGPDANGVAREAHFDLYVDRDSGAVEIVLSERRTVLRTGEWSGWMRVDYGRESYRLSHLTGNVRFYLKAVRPHLQLYMTPVNLDPQNPAMPISVPADEAARLQAAMGSYYTQGMPDDTKALEAAVFDYDEFLSQDSLAMEERRGHLRRELAQFESGFLFFYVHSLDQISHMLWRTTDSSHPGYRPEFARHGQAIEHHYESMDELLGEAMTSMGGDGQIVVLSDHGFAPYERSFNINSWLHSEGYLQVKDGVHPVGASILSRRSILWEQTQAYGLGLNALYLNLRGREDPGAVEADEREVLMAVITTRLLAVVDPRDGRQVVEKVYVVDRPADSATANMPDLLIGYARGYRSSGTAALGQIEAEVIQDNLSAWSGDHCMADHTVPGVLVTSMPLNTDQLPHLRDIPGNILQYYGMEVPDAMKGRSVWRH